MQLIGTLESGYGISGRVGRVLEVRLMAVQVH